MEPRIQYCKTEDGVNIAFCTLGEGMPFVHMPFPLNHVQLLWQNPTWRPWLEKMSGRYRLVQYDGRGNGMSERGLTDYSLDAHVRDLGAVVDRLQLDHFVLFGPWGYSQAAVRYSVENSDRVAALVLWCGFANFGPLVSTFSVDVPKQSWDFFLQTIAQTLSWAEPQEVSEFINVLRESCSQDDYLAYIADLMRSDVEPLLPRVTTRTLVLHPRGLPIVSKQAATQLATLIPNAQLVLLDGAASMPAGGNLEPVLRAIDGFLEEVITGRRLANDGQAQSAFHTILFTDVEGSTALTQRLGDAKARGLLREHERIVREALKAHGGAEVKTLGDGFMASFSSATKALECAIAMQRAFAEWNETRRGGSRTAPTTEPIRVRIGLNAGEPIAEDDPDGRSDLFGTTVNEAARITATANGEEILVSDVVRQLAKGKDFLFADRGEANLKGFDEPVRLFEVRWREEG